MRFAFLVVSSCVVVACGGEVSGGIDSGAPLDAAKDVVATTDAGNGCNSNTDCRSDGYCDFHGRCALSSNRFGKCIFKPTVCGKPSGPAYVCGCDGKTYSSECEAKTLGVDVDDNGGCGSPGKEFQKCGAKFCNVLTQYCIVTGNDAIDPNDPVARTYSCAPLPGTCTSGATCACFPQNIPCGGGKCEQTNGLVTFICPGG
ncbi:hypothetical protein BH09MYX1_BH09MYX1_06370 [soil metagenome]